MMKTDEAKTNFLGMSGGVGVMALGAAFNVVTVGQVGAGVAMAFAAKAGYEWVRDRAQENSNTPASGSKDDSDNKNDLGL